LKWTLDAYGAKEQIERLLPAMIGKVSP